MQQTRVFPNAASMLAHRLRRWPTIGPALGECLVFAGIVLHGFTVLSAIFRIEQPPA